MKHFPTLFWHEIRQLLISPAAYTAAVLFLVLMGSIYFLLLEEFSLSVQDQSMSELFFQLYWLPVFFAVPLLTMKSIAEERRLGTLENLLTTPTTMLEIVLSKFLAAYLFYLLLWAFTLLFPLLATWGSGREDIGIQLTEPGVMGGGFLFVAITGTFFIACGIFSSCLTRSQLVAGMLCFSILFVFIVGIPALQEYLEMIQSPLNELLGYLRAARHRDEFCSGVIDTRPVFFYLSTSALVLGLSAWIMESKV